MSAETEIAQRAVTALRHYRDGVEAGHAEAAAAIAVVLPPPGVDVASGSFGAIRAVLADPEKALAEHDQVLREEIADDIQQLEGDFHDVSLLAQVARIVRGGARC